ncbi:hypothetical protein RRG08_059409 [Elysia crispata]|uniref:Uncharacterized protein n=1 Tax=Elysia crispata TaxID=231223 RepID=A0AAE1D7L3_9GAST|nr:hypothetical protein RRG08_059409 [Elysia crispata]
MIIHASRIVWKSHINLLLWGKHILTQSNATDEYSYHVLDDLVSDPYYMPLASDEISENHSPDDGIERHEHRPATSVNASQPQNVPACDQQDNNFESCQELSRG